MARSLALDRARSNQKEKIHIILHGYAEWLEMAMDIDFLYDMVAKRHKVRKNKKYFSVISGGYEH